MPNQVKPVPEGYRTMTPNLVCRNAARAIEFYKTAFGATELRRAPGPNGEILHAELQIGDSKFFINDSMSKTPAQPRRRGQQPHVHPLVCPGRRRDL